MQTVIIAKLVCGEGGGAMSGFFRGAIYLRPALVVVVVVVIVVVVVVVVVVGVAAEVDYRHHRFLSRKKGPGTQT
jgi:membrane protein YdbS with pleckstrin-like domain